MATTETRVADLLLPFDLRMLGRRIQEVRLEKDKTIEALAADAKVNKNTIVRLEKGGGTQITVINKVCAALGVSPQKLIARKLEAGKDYSVRKRRKSREQGERQSVAKQVDRQARKK